jgi:hypothetical protein
MQDPVEDAAEAVRALNAHLTAMGNAAAAIEELLGEWAQEWARTTSDDAVSADPHRTEKLHVTGSYYQFREELDAIETDLPDRIANGLRRSAWRHLYVDVMRTGSGLLMSDLDYGIWQESGYKLPPAYEPVVSKELSRVTQCLRKYGYRPSIETTGPKHRHSVPPQAIAPMETYYRLSLRLPEVVRVAEEARARVPQAPVAAGPTGASGQFDYL